ncbi:MAG TPA: DUF4157 domain-containing protein [Acetobacteraceae bacterium]|nr:DUF4157 domain-containing protein [Acetobacteraceae bacterium]
MLNHAVGNASLERMLASPPDGGRRLVGQPGDRHERQADQFAAAATSLATVPDGVRLHTDAPAAEIASQLSARAVTIGQDIFFGAGQFRPGTVEGGRLLAHEVVHTVQQRESGGDLGRAPLIQRQPEGGTREEPITAATILPFPRGSRVALNRIMPNALFDLLSGTAPDVGASLRAIDRQVATVTTATADLVAATVAEPITLPGAGGASTTYRDLTLSLRRHEGGTYTLSLSARTEGQPVPVTLFERADLTPRREGREIVLSSGAATAPVPELRIGPGAESGQTRVEAFSGPYLNQIPEYLHALVPARFELLSLTALPAAPAGSAREQAAVAELASRTASARQQPRQQITAGGGAGLAASQFSPLLSAAWQISFRPFGSYSGFFQVPLEVQIQYAPSAFAIGSVTSGVQGTLAPLKIPVNLRLMVGAGGGGIQGAAGPRQTAIGPTAGLGAGVELGAWRVDARYEHLFGFLSSTPGVDTLGLRFGRAF